MDADGELMDCACRRRASHAFHASLATARCPPPCFSYRNTDTAAQNKHRRQRVRASLRPLSPPAHIGRAAPRPVLSQSVQSARSHTCTITQNTPGRCSRCCSRPRDLSPRSATSSLCSLTHSRTPSLLSLCLQLALLPLHNAQLNLRPEGADQALDRPRGRRPARRSCGPRSGTRAPRACRSP